MDPPAAPVRMASVLKASGTAQRESFVWSSSTKWLKSATISYCDTSYQEDAHSDGFYALQPRCYRDEFLPQFFISTSYPAARRGQSRRDSESAHRRTSDKQILSGVRDSKHIAI